MRALITQRESTDQHGTPIDSLESSYVLFFEKLGVHLHMISNFHTNLGDVLSREYYDGVIISGGGSIPSKYYDKPHPYSLQVNRDQVELTIIQEAMKRGTPILAICRGMQYVNGILGGQVTRLDRLNMERKIGEDHPVVIGDRVIEVNHYHNDGIYVDGLAKALRPIAIDNENATVEAYYSRTNKILGIQWHPDRAFQHDESQALSTALVKSFIESGGVLDEGDYFSSRARD